MLKRFFRFESVIYPLWRRQMPMWLSAIADPFLSQFYPVYADRRPPETPQAMARFLRDWDILPERDLQTLSKDLETVKLRLACADTTATPPLHDRSKVRIPAQWERTERALVSWGRMYPNMWQMHAQMVEAISHVATAEVLVPSELWARAVALYLTVRGRANLDNVEFLVLRTDDIWIRDFGPIMGVDSRGQRISLNPIYDVLPQYPQADDNRMVDLWSAHHNIPVQPIDLHTEGGNLWSDGQGTLLMSSQIFYSNRYYTRDTLLEYLHSIIDFEKLIITPRLTLEETGHVDLLAKLASPDLVFVSKAESFSTEEIMRKAKRLFLRETNANGMPYHVVELPTPSLYINWFNHTIRRAYTNSLTINGCVLVPVFGIKQDDVALRTYADNMPEYQIIPIDSTVGINGGGAVHCMTKEVPFVG